MTRCRWIAALLPALLGGLVLAQAPAGDGPVASAPASSEAVKYLSGGAGEEERAQLMAQWPSYPLLIVFSGAGSAYAVADSVRITNAQGAVLLEVPQAGPLLMLNLPPGDYHARARVGDAVQERGLQLGSRPLRLDWRL